MHEKVFFSQLHIKNEVRISSTYFLKKLHPAVFSQEISQSGAMNACSTQYRRRFSSLRANDRCTHSFPRKRFLCGGGVGGLLTSSLPPYIPYPPPLLAIPKSGVGGKERCWVSNQATRSAHPVFKGFDEFYAFDSEKARQKGFFLLQFLNSPSLHGMLAKVQPFQEASRDGEEAGWGQAIIKSQSNLDLTILVCTSLPT